MRIVFSPPAGEVAGLLTLRWAEPPISLPCCPRVPQPFGTHAAGQPQMAFGDVAEAT